MLEQKRINEAELNFKRYLQDGWLSKQKQIPQYAQFFLEKLAKFIDSYEENKNAAMEIVGAEERAHELVESFEQERRKRHKFQYELGVEAKHNFAKTSLERASAFVAEIRNILK